MGYTTIFYDRFQLNKPLEKHISDEIDSLSEKGCFWTYYNEDNTIGWNGYEKFYRYLFWLDFIISHYLEPNDYVLNGKIAFAGEEGYDIGIIKIQNNKIMTTRNIVYEYNAINKKSKINISKNDYFLLVNEINLIIKSAKINKFMSVGQICNVFVDPSHLILANDNYVSKGDCLKYILYDIKKDTDTNELIKNLEFLTDDEESDNDNNNKESDG